MDFKAEIKNTSQRKLVSGDNQYTITFGTNNPLILDLGKLKADSVVKVTVELEGNAKKESKQRSSRPSIEEL